MSSPEISMLIVSFLQEKWQKITIQTKPTEIRVWENIEVEFSSLL